MTKSSASFYKGFLLILLANSLIWLKSSYGKFSGGTFVDNIGKSLSAFASKNPHAFVKDFLETTAIPNSNLFGLLTLWGETFAAVGSVVALIYLLVSKPTKWVVYLLLIALLTGAFLNLVFYFAAGWMSPSTESLNLVMLAVQVIGFTFALKLLKDR